ncbi:uncharacterized protein LOC119736600 [Patiria miniata]|uniref:G-protein coupled receptors family 1 profile domain-containing protein n=1 Tax=Patiria miniata TaxID=46514 RepID=A0A914ASU4_PATMI|nr:uncharacterized protein LOC119736600 [Patiria miniata]
MYEDEHHFTTVIRRNWCCPIQAPRGTIDTTIYCISVNMASSDMTDMSVSSSWQYSSEDNITACDGVVTGEPAAIFMYVIMAPTTILVVILNPLCLVALRRTSGIQDTTKTFLASLTISDLCAGIFWGIPKLIEYASVVTPALESFICITVYHVAYLFFTTSILSLLLMTIDRYIAIAHSLHYPSLMTPRRSKVIVALVWAAAFVLHASFAITIEAQSTYLCKYSCYVCEYIYICIVVISLGIILVLYVRILKIARHQARRIAAQNQVANPQGEQNAPHRVSTRSATTVIMVTGSAFLCWAPQIVYVTLVQEVEQYPCAITYITDILFLTNGWLNVVIYYWRNRELRKAMRSLVTSHHHMSVSTWGNSFEDNITGCYGVVTCVPVAIITYVIMALTTILVVVLNPLCLVALRRTSSIQDTTKTFMASLTISDLCAGIFWGIPKLIEYASVVTPELADFLCVMIDLVAPLLFTISILSLLLMTIDRYIAIVHSLHYPSLMTPQRSKVIVALVWTAALVLQVALYFATAVQSSKLCESVCNICNYMLLCTVVISLGIILVFYARILKIARRQARLIAAQNQVANPQGEQNAPHRVSTRSATTVIIVTGSAFICWAPQIVHVNLMQEVEQYPCVIIYISEILFLTNGWLNVLIYYWRNRELRAAMRSLVTSHRR